MNTAKQDITTLDDIQLMVDEFYTSVRADDMLGYIFEGVIEDRWPEHLGKMYTFWQTVLLHEMTYRGQPFAPHARLPVSQQHFDRWIALFEANVDRHFSGPVADEAKRRANIMARLFDSKLNHLRSSGMIPIL